MRGIARILFASIFSVSLACCGHALMRAERHDGLREARQARKLLKGGRPAEGYERLERLLSEHPKQLDVNRWYVEAAAKTGRLDEARAYYERLRESGRMPEVAEYGLALVDAARGGEGFEGAVAHLRKAIRLAPKTAEFHYRLGLLYLLDSRASEARAPLERALDLEPENARYRVVYADALCQLRKDDEAMAALEPLLRRDVPAEIIEKARGVADRIFDPMRGSVPEVQGDLRRATELLSSDLVHQALVVIDKVLVRFPQDPLALTLKGLAHYRLLNHAEAVAAFERALQVQPKNPSALVGLGDVYFSLERQGKAQQYYEKAVELNPFYAEAYRRLGEVAAARRDHEMAARAFAKLVMLNPNSLQDHYRWAWELVAAGHLEQALGVYLSIVEKNPEELEALLRIGSLHQMLARQDPQKRTEHLRLARQYLERARSIDPENQAVKEMLDKMEK